ncbi:MAG: glycoside hydrolase family 15 protein [Candidatus Dormibacteraceae bacterium]
MRRRLFFVLGGLALLGALFPLVNVLSGGSEWTAEVAPSSAPAPDRWTSGNKDAIGTAHSTASPLWFTAVHGTLADLLYPTVDRDNLRQFGFLVSDGSTFFFDASSQGVASSRVTDDRALTYELRVDDPAHHFSLVTTIATDATSPVVFVRTHLIGDSSRLHVYAYLVPHLEDSSAGQTAFFDGKRGYVSKGGTWLAIGGDAVTGPRTAGYLGSGDGYDQLHHQTLANRYRRAGPGRVTLTWELPQSGSWTSALAFGATRHGADGALDAAMHRGAQIVFDAYRDGWRQYAGTLNAPQGAARLFFYSAEVIKMAEDKQHPGAIVASLALPWGDTATDDAGDVGYRKVWPRDLYHAAIGLLAAGDESTAADVARFMGRQQRPDGSMPQNTDLEGAPVWTAQQLDETADAVLLAVRMSRVLKAGEGPDIARAADYLASHGPATQQERWEEVGGYSPATMAAEIAALNAAVSWSGKTGASADRATVWVDTSRRWDAALDAETFTRTGPLGSGYYLRITADGHPDSADLINIANRGGVWDEREIVDPSYLELVRLRVRGATDLRVRATIAVVDAAASGQARGMTLWYRYPHDGYGEKNAGSAPPGKGHLWPLLTAERGVYEVMAGGNPRPYLAGLESLAGSDQLLGEQVWEESGEPTGSARPLVWAHAEYIVLARAVATGLVE